MSKACLACSGLLKKKREKKEETKRDISIIFTLKLIKIEYVETENKIYQGLQRERQNLTKNMY